MPAPIAIAAPPPAASPEGIEGRDRFRTASCRAADWSPAISSAPGGGRAPAGLLLGIDRLAALCTRRYRACRLLEDVTTVAAFSAAFGVIAAGVYHHPDVAAILGAVTGVLYGMHPVFAFDRRADRYRALISDARNLAMRARNSRVPVPQLVRELNELTRRQSLA